MTTELLRWLPRLLAMSLLWGLVFLVTTTPSFQEKPCPYLGPALPSKRSPINCAAVMRGDQSSIEAASQYPWCIPQNTMRDVDFISATEDCKSFVQHRGYDLPVVTPEELHFPIAFSMLMYENVEQFERLLRAIYRPQNLYCIHVDAKSLRSTHNAVQGIASCFPNVFVAARLVDIHWGEFSLLDAELSCVRDLFDHQMPWKYYINLTGREFPLKTNRELVEILKSYKGGNDVDGTPHKRPIMWTRYVWRSENWRTSVEKGPVPHKFLIAKGSTHVAVTRDFIDYALNNPRAQDLLEWMRDIRAPDEHFFPTLNHNPHLNVPGAYKGDPDLKWFFNRYKLWWNEKGSDTCAGQWVRFICNLGVKDLPALVGTKPLFVNKLRLEQDPVAFHCLEQWHQNRTADPALSDLDLDFYAKRDFALNHV